MSNKDSDSDRFIPTQSHPIVELTNRSTKKPEGFVCPSCGHLAVDEDELIGLTCPKCLQKWLDDQNVNKMVPIKELKDERDSALVPTIKLPMEKHPYDETTKIMPMPKISTITIKEKKVTDSDDRIPGLD